MRYLEVAVRCGRPAAEAVAAVLTELAGGVAIEDPLDIIQNRANWDCTDLEPGDPRWVTVKAYLPEAAGPEAVRLEVEGALARVRGQDLGEVAPPAWAWVAEEDWANAWKAYFKPVRVGRVLTVVPSWEQVEPMEGEVLITLDPGMVFGTGTHPTTALCLQWLEELVTPGLRLIDVGTGSGILGIAAAKLGAAAVLALDVDPVAMQVAGENARLNGVADRITLARGAFGGEEAAAAAAAWLQAGPPGLVVANIVADVIIPMAPLVVPVLAPGGHFLASGVIASSRYPVTRAMVQAGLQVLAAREEAGWVAILAQAPA